MTGMDMVRDTAMSGSPLMDRASTSLQSMMGSTYDPTRGNPYEGKTTKVGTNKYSGENLYLDDMIGSAQRDVSRSFMENNVPGLMSQFQTGGAFGGTAMNQAMQGEQRVLGERLGDISTQLRSDDYNRQAMLAESDIDRRMSAQQNDLARNAGLAENRVGRHYDAYFQNQNNRLNAIGLAPQLNDARYDDARALMSIGAQQQGLAQNAYDVGYDNFTEWRDWDANRLGALTNALGAIQGGTSAQTGANPNYRSAGQNAAGYAALLASLWG